MSLTPATEALFRPQKSSEGNQGIAKRKKKNKGKKREVWCTQLLHSQKEKENSHCLAF